MDRLIIIGNGFDIAHGLKTKYSDFISEYWKNIEDSDYQDKFFKFKSGYNLKSCSSLNSVVEHISGYFPDMEKTRRSRKHFYKSTNSKSDVKSEILIEVLNSFFCRINERFDEVNWVDIEMEYYSSLKKILNRTRYNGYTDDMFEEQTFEQILELNNDISQIINEFDNYLESKVSLNISTRYNKEIDRLFIQDSISNYDLKKFYDEFPKKFVEKELKPFFQKQQSESIPPLKFEKTFVLNFNYTNTISLYFSNSLATIINIHGEIKNAKNPINLGFGDERDKNYGDIEDHNQNEYLRFMKSFFYSNNNNYKQLFDFVEATQFQVQVMGHSCGLSDRTLLNAIFEHANCKSIKVYYHEYSTQKEDGQNDNYSEIVKNISRHFNQKTLMRDKIVNKTLCAKLPQLLS